MRKMLQSNQRDILINSGWLTFAGMRGRLCDMQKQGWQFAINLDYNPRYGDRFIHLAAKHAAAHVELLAKSFNVFDELRTVTNYFELEFYTELVAPRIQVAKTHVNQSLRFGAFDAMDMSHSRISIEDLFELGSVAFFKPREASKEIFIPEKEIWTVEKHLEAILEAQKPYQDELRRKHLDLQSKKKLNEGGEDKTFASLIAV
jgi:hypothetical protein